MGKVLTDAQRRQYETDGLLFPIRVLDPAQAAHYRQASDELEERLGGKPRTIEVRQMHLHFRWAFELATEPRVLDAVEDLLGPDLLVWATELFAKHPQDTAVSIGWHRDQPYMGFEPRHAATAWIALSQSNSENGCMRALVEGPERHVRASGERAARTAEPRADAGERLTDVLLEPGEMSLHDVHLLHGSSPNRSHTKRVGFVVRFVTPLACPTVGRPPAVLVRGRDRYNHFHLVEPPGECDTEQALAGMKRSAALHLETMLGNVKTTAPR